MVSAISRNLVEIDDGNCPFRWGRLATNGIKPYTRMLHATMAGLLLKEAGGVLPGDVTSSRRAAGQAWRHVRTAGEWRHDSDMMPLLLKPDAMAKIQYVIDALTFVAVKQVDNVESARRQVSLLHLLIKSPASQAFPTCLALAKQCLSTSLIQHWIRFKCDVRYNADARTYDDHYVCNVCTIVMPLASDELTSDETRYIQNNFAAYGYHAQARQEATRGEGILAPLVSPAKLASVYSITNTMDALQSPIDLPTVPLPTQ